MYKTQVGCWKCWFGCNSNCLEPYVSPSIDVREFKSIEGMLEHVKRRNKEIEKFMRYKRKKEIDIGW